MSVAPTLVLRESDRDGLGELAHLSSVPSGLARWYDHRQIFCCKLVKPHHILYLIQTSLILSIVSESVALIPSSVPRTYERSSDHVLIDDRTICLKYTMLDAG